MNIPQIDLAEFTKGNAEQKQKFVEELGKAYEEVGFVAVKNHGIPQDLIDQLYSNLERFFTLPIEQKEQYNLPGMAGQRGYTSFGQEHAKGFEAPDLKEFFQFGQNPDATKDPNITYAENVVVAEIPDFTPNMLSVFRYFEQSGTSMLQAIALFLGLEENYFDEHVTYGNSILRGIYYPPITSEPASAIRSEQHEDINLITLLVGSSADGLQILTNDGQWISVTSLPDQIVVNVGDMLQRLTNNRLKSTTHRVINPPPERWHTPRYSIPFFLHPKRNMSLACLESCISENSPKVYEDLTAGEYLDERLREIGLLK